MTSWQMFAQRSKREGQERWLTVGSAQYVRMHGYLSPTSVTVTEDPEGTYLGWLKQGESEPVMIQHKRIFEIQFPYGSKVEVERGKGLVVPLSIRANEEGES